MADADALGWLMAWYGGQCDGEWEHQYGVEIGTLDNPGWTLKVDLADTALDGCVFPRQTQNYVDDAEWWICWTEGNQFHGAGGPLQLAAMIGVFRDWTQSRGQGDTPS